MAVAQSVSGVAGGAGTSIDVPFSTLVTDGHAYIVRVTVELGGALHACVVLPLSTAEDGRGGGSTCCASSIGIDVISSIAPLTDSLSSVEYGAVLVNFATNTVVVEDVAGRALSADTVLPGLATKIVVNGF